MRSNYTTQIKIITIALLAGLIFLVISALKPDTDADQRLLAQGFEFLAHEGLQDVDAIRTANHYQTRMVTYRQWTKFHGSVPTEETLTSVGWSWDMPIFVLAAQGTTILN